MATRGAVSLLCAALVLVGSCSSEPPGDELFVDSSQPLASDRPPLLAVAVVTGGLHACALGVDRRTYCWGDNRQGQLGDGSNVASSRPVRVAGGLHFQQITSGGAGHSCALTWDGKAYCWGTNHFGQLGDGTTTSRNAPVRAAEGHLFTQIDAGPYHSCGITESGEAYCWGANAPADARFPGRTPVGYALGAPTTELCDNPDPGYRGAKWPCSRAPLEVTGDHSFRSISAGMWSTCGVEEDGSAYCWGLNAFDELGTGLSSGATAPTAVGGGLLFADLVLGAVHGCGLVGDAAYCWGGRLPILNWGSLGTDSLAGSSVPAQVSGGLAFARVVASAANNIFASTCAITTDGSPYCWGCNSRGQLGTEAPLPLCSTPSGLTRRCSPIPVPVAGGLRFDDVAVGQTHACAVARDRAVYCWGANDCGQVGDGAPSNLCAINNANALAHDRSTPVRVLSPVIRAGAPAAAAAP